VLTAPLCAPSCAHAPQEHPARPPLATARSATRLAAALATALLLLLPAGAATAATAAGSTTHGTAAGVQQRHVPDHPDGQLLPPRGDTVGPADGPPDQPAVPGHHPSTQGGMSPWLVLGLVALVVASLAMAGVAFSTLWWMLHAWRHTESLEATRFSPSPTAPRRSFSLLLPARHEEDVLGHTIDALARSDHPDFEILVIIGHDDPGTEIVAREAAERYPGLVRVIIDESVPKNKPRGMNTALPYCRGDVVGVFDAEDEVHPDLLRLIDGRFSETGADIVQGGVQLMNVRSTWWSLRNCLEYYFWFRSRLHFHAEARFIPLGGNTVFVRTDLLRAAGGWDGDCLAEDCELGVRLSTAGAKVAVAYDPRVVTREETPGSMRALVKQRTRWSQGFLQVLRKRAWKELPTFRQRALARYTLAMPFLQAFTGLMIPLSIALMFLVKVPMVVALLTFVPLVPTLVTLSVEAAGLGDFGRSYGIRIRAWDYVRLVVGTFPYQVFLAFAALRAIWRETRGDSSWEKTAHAGAHINPAASSRQPDVLAGAHDDLVARKATR